MAEPRATTTQRAVLSYSQLKSMVDKWPDLLIKDYQGIGQDSTYIAGEIDDLEVIVIENKEDIIELQDSHYPNVSTQIQFLQQQFNGLPEFTIDTTGFTFDSTEITFDKVIA
tara:strand:+ start:1127 stop:1462 length:336 start_codon:yes stop_codon:yes gene_type:complete